MLYSNHYNKITGIIPPYPNKDKHWDGKWVIEINPPDCFNVTLDELKPIPLTPDVLEKCGFEISVWHGPKDDSNNNMEATNDYVSLGKHIERNAWVFAYDNVFGVRKVTGSRIIKYLHQLQNLYFALTGEELEYQP